MLIFEELVQRRGKKVSAMREGLAVLHFDDYLHLQTTREMFLAKQAQVTWSDFELLVDWPVDNTLSNAEKMAVDWLKKFDADDYTTAGLLKFCTGFKSVSSLKVQGKKISIDFLPGEVLPKASACSCTLLLPLGNKDMKDFFDMLKRGILFECEGFGDY